MPSDPTVELWTLYAIGVSFTIFRTYARITAVGFRQLRPDDFLIWVAMLIYTAQCSLGYSVGVAARGLANNAMTGAQRSALSPKDPEYEWRVIGSKIQVAGWTSATCLLWTLKLCVAFFYLRLTDGLQRFRLRIHIAMGLIITTFIVLILTILLSCRPFHHYWQINPDPGNVCQAAVSKPIVWVMFVSNVATDVFLFLIPLPMLWQSSLRLVKKLAATLVLSAGVFIVVCAILKSVFVLVDPGHGGQLAASWGTRETFVSVIATNLPMVFPLFKVWFRPWLPSTNRSTSNKKSYKMHGSGFVSIGGGGGSTRQGPNSGRDGTSNRTFDNESEEHIVKSSGDVKLQIMHDTVDTPSTLNANDIVVSTHVSVTTEDKGSDKSGKSFLVV